MASTNTFSPSPPVNNNAPSIELSSRTINKATTGGGGAPFLVRISRKTNGYERTSCSANLAFATDGGGGGEGPSCIFVGPIETASKETLEALYRQARDAYYSGKPLIVDDMFDKVELKLRWYGSESVVKYPRCSLRRQSTYSDAEEDASQVWALASVWILILAFGSLAFLVPTIYAILLAFQDMFNARLTSNGSTTALESLAMLNRMLLILIGSIVGYPIASASVGALQGLWKNDLAALKGACPSCGEEVFAFVKADQSKQIPHKADCHVCESSLEFRHRVEDSISAPSKRWVHGRIYLLRQRGKNRHQRRMY